MSDAERGQGTPHRRRLPAPEAVRWLVRALEAAGYETWAVGGAVRDELLGGISSDWDFATAARPEDVGRVFQRTVPIGVEHGTVGVLSRSGVLYEVTTFRKDIETDGRRAVVRFADRLEDDLARRDFTINAVAWHPLREEIFDPYSGAADLRARVLRTVGEPAARFAEDRLRVLRALRFAGRFGLRIDPDTWRALRAAVPELPRLSAERVREELTKVLEGDVKPSGALDLYRESGALAVLYPELAPPEPADGLPGDLRSWRRALECVDALRAHRGHLRLSALLACAPGPAAAAAILDRLRFSRTLSDQVVRLHAALVERPSPEASEADLRRWLARHASAGLRDVARLWIAEYRTGTGAPDPLDAVHGLRGVLRTHPPLTVADLALDGRDLIRLGLKPGPEFGRILDALLERVLADPEANRRELLEAWAREEAGRESSSGGSVSEGDRP